MSNTYPPKPAVDRLCTPAERVQTDNIFNNFAGDLSNGAAELDKNTKLLMLSMYKPYIEWRGSTLFNFGNLITSIDSASTRLDEFGDDAATRVGEFFKPVSTALGTVVGTLTNILKDPIGAVEAIPRALNDTLTSINPEWGISLDATFKNFKIDNIKNLPSSLVGSGRSLLGTVDAILTFPIILLSDIYFGVMSLMQAISKEIDEIIAGLYKFVFKILDEIIPLTEILTLLNTIQEVANEISGIITIFSGANQISGFLNNVINISGSLERLIQNPLDLAFAYLPPQVSEGLYLIRNPQEIINRILPPELSQFFAQAAQVIGVGFNGNMGYGLQSILQTLQNGVLSSILTNFSSQYKILTPLLKAIPQGGLQKTLPPGYTAWITNPAVAVARRQRVPSGSPSPIIQ